MTISISREMPELAFSHYLAGTSPSVSQAREMLDIELIRAVFDWNKQ